MRFTVNDDTFNPSPWKKKKKKKRKRKKVLYARDMIYLLFLKDVY